MMYIIFIILMILIKLTLKTSIIRMLFLSIIPLTFGILFNIYAKLILNEVILSYLNI
jgi:hypothetical protein